MAKPVGQSDIGPEQLATRPAERSHQSVGEVRRDLAVLDRPSRHRVNLATIVFTLGFGLLFNRQIFFGSEKATFSVGQHTPNLSGQRERCKEPRDSHFERFLENSENARKSETRWQLFGNICYNPDTNRGLSS